MIKLYTLTTTRYVLTDDEDGIAEALAAEHATCEVAEVTKRPRGEGANAEVVPVGEAATTVVMAHRAMTGAPMTSGHAIAAIRKRDAK